MGELTGVTKHATRRELVGSVMNDTPAAVVLIAATDNPGKCRSQGVIGDVSCRSTAGATISVK